MNGSNYSEPHNILLVDETRPQLIPPTTSCSKGIVQWTLNNGTMNASDCGNDTCTDSSDVVISEESLAIASLMSMREHRPVVTTVNACAKPVVEAQVFVSEEENQNHQPQQPLMLAQSPPPPLVPSKEELDELKTSRSRAALYSWYRRLNELYQFKCIHGHCDVPQKYPENRCLGIWVNKQRCEKVVFDQLQQHPEHAVNNSHSNKAIFTPQKLYHLEQIGFVWAKRKGDYIWNERYMELYEFYKKHGHSDLPCKYRPQPTLGRWVTSQRSMYKRGLLPKEYIDKLNAIKFTWDMYAFLNNGTTSSSSSNNNNNRESITNTNIIAAGVEDNADPNSMKNGEKEDYDGVQELRSDGHRCNQVHSSEVIISSSTCREAGKITEEVVGIPSDLKHQVKDNVGKDIILVGCPLLENLLPVKQQPQKVRNKRGTIVVKEATTEIEKNLYEAMVASQSNHSNSSVFITNRNKSGTINVKEATTEIEKKLNRAMVASQSNHSNSSVCIEDNDVGNDGCNGNVVQSSSSSSNSYKKRDKRLDLDGITNKFVARKKQKQSSVLDNSSNAKENNVSTNGSSPNTTASGYETVARTSSSAPPTPATPTRFHFTRSGGINSPTTRYNSKDPYFIEKTRTATTTANKVKKNKNTTSNVALVIHSNNSKIKRRQGTTTLKTKNPMIMKPKKKLPLVHDRRRTTNNTNKKLPLVHDRHHANNNSNDSSGTSTVTEVTDDE